ncbi:MAG: toll/interleukin-1 receptor domain-containing protein [Myxococcota bacterium]
MRYLTTFLSHSSADAEFVHAVADDLVRRGVIPWLDAHELTIGVSLTEALSRAIHQGDTLTLFLSAEALASRWVDDELRLALDLARKYPERTDSVLPVFLDDPSDMVRNHTRLAPEWLHPDGDRVDALGVCVDPDREDAVQDAARQIARRLYERAEMHTHSEFALVVDQRGSGRRTGLPDDIPPNLDRLDIPALVLRPDTGQRSYGSVCMAEDWHRWAATTQEALSDALGTLRGRRRTIRILGRSQLSVPTLLGRHFDRTSQVDLTAHNDGAQVLRVRCGQHAPLDGGDPGADRPIPDLPGPPEESFDELALLVMREGYVDSARRHLEEDAATTPASWVPHDAHIETDDDLLAIAADVVAVVTRFRREHGVRSIRLYSSLPFHALAVLAAHLTPHVVPRVTFMEYLRDEATYAPLALPTS